MTQTILLLQREGADRDAVVAAVGPEKHGLYRVECMDAVAAGIQRFAPRERADAIAAVLLELDLDDSQGISTFIRVNAAAPQCPMLILCNLKNEITARLAVHRGAQDYLLMSRVSDYTLNKALGLMLVRASIAKSRSQKKETAQLTLNAIGDAVITTNVGGDTMYLNAIAEGLTGWPNAEARGRPIGEVLRLIDADSREALPSPLTQAIKGGKTVMVAPNCVLIHRDGTEAAIEDTASPIRNHQGRVTGAVMVFRDVSQARAAAQKLAHLAQYDSLTDLVNSGLLRDRLQQAVSLAQRRGSKMAVLFMDIDDFKSINDTYGPSVGNEVLCSLSRRLLASVRESDTVSRYGGDEFVVLLPEINHAQDASRTADKILAAASAAHVYDGNEIRIDASIGIAVYPDNGGNGAVLLENADKAMYRAKRKGGNSYCFSESDLSGRAVAAKRQERTEA